MKETKYFQLPDGGYPYLIWFKKLKDKLTKAIIQRRIQSVRAGNLGDVSDCGNGVHELKIDFGPGYRIYFGNDGEALIIILCGGVKGSQERDIKKAHEYWEVYKRGKK